MLPCNFMVTNIAIWRPQFCFGFVCLHFCDGCSVCFFFHRQVLIFTWCGLFIIPPCSTGKQQSASVRCAVGIGRRLDSFGALKPLITLSWLCNKLQWCCTSTSPNIKTISPTSTECICLCLDGVFDFSNVAIAALYLSHKGNYEPK